MQEVKLKIRIEKPVDDVFAFTINPTNTPKWIENISIEETSEWPIKIGSVYRNQNQNGEWSEYVVTEFEENRMFVFSQKDSKYHVKYTLTPINDHSCELEYYEWVEEGQLEDPFTPDILQKLKAVIEAR